MSQAEHKMTIIPNMAEILSNRKIVHRTLAECAGVDITVVRKAARGQQIRVSSAQFIWQALELCNFQGKKWWTK
jgi:DNA-binding Xre family transcriptional regulator